MIFGRAESRAFTVTETLVAVALLAILLMVGLPILEMASRKSAASRCASQLRQVGAAFIAYASDYGELPSYLHGNTRWFEGSEDPRSFFAGPYLGTRARDLRKGAGSTAAGGVFDCPAITDKGSLAPPEFAGFDYAYNITLTGHRLGLLGHPARTVLATEGGDWARVKAQFSGSPKYIAPARSENPGGTAWNGANRPILYPHNNHANFLFLDGHLEPLRQSHLSESHFNGIY